MKDRKWCPACKEKLDRFVDFGRRVVAGKVYPDAYCKKCRSLRSQDYKIRLSSI